MDGPLDFESELLFRTSPAPAKKRKKVIGLDDLVTDFYKEKSKHIEKAKRAKTKTTYNSDEEEEDAREATLSKYVDDCQKQICEISEEAEISLWGLKVFGDQKVLPSLVFPEIESCLLLKSVGHHLNSLVELNIERGVSFLEGLLAGGWLLKLVHVCGQVEKSIAAWTFNLMLYSSEEVLRSSACEFWSAILTLKNEGNSPRIKIDWLPSYSEIKGALHVYGFLMFSPTKYLSNVEIVREGSNCVSPPQNIRAWIKFVTACSQVRNVHSIFTTSEAADLVVWIICLLLDRQLLGLSVILQECLLSVISSFTDEWHKSCEIIANSLACTIPKDMNCLRVVESISGADARSKHLRRRVAFQILLSCFEGKVLEADEVLQFLLSINVKEKNCDLFKAYIYLVLTENWLVSNPLMEERPLIKEMWCLYLRNYSCQISSTDLRSYASKVISSLLTYFSYRERHHLKSYVQIRSKASYLLQRTADK